MLTAGAFAGLAGLGAGARHGAGAHRRGRGELRVRRHHGRPARPVQAAGHGVRGHPVRRAARRRRRHAGPHRDARSTSCSSCSPSSSCSSRPRRWSGRCSGCRHRTRHAPRSRSSPQRRRSAHERPHDRRDAGRRPGPPPSWSCPRSSGTRRSPTASSRCSALVVFGLLGTERRAQHVRRLDAEDFIQFTPFSVPSKLTAIVLCLAALALAGRVVLRDAPPAQKAGAWLPITYGVPHGVRVPGVGRRGQGRAGCR